MAREIFIVFALIVVSSAQRFECRPNESWAECGYYCEPSCSNPKPEVCPAIACSDATANCRCDEGYYRDTGSQECVPFDKCPSGNYTCGPNESVNICGGLCEPTCRIPKPEFCVTVACDKSTIGCRCDEGFYRDEVTQECIPIDKCPNPNLNCCANETMNLCGRICEPSCTNPNPRVCPKIACTNATANCRCNEGYYRDPVSQKCIRFGECPACGPNEQLGNCGRICEGNCTHPELSEECAATSCEGNACQCMPGFVRDPISDRCVEYSQCPPKQCKRFEIDAPCGKTCEGTCKEPFLPEICTRIRCSRSDCRCDLDSGYVRNEATGECVHIRECGSRCPPNSEPRVCGSVCESTCRNPTEILCKIDPSTCRVDCRCSKGYVRDERTNRCVKPENCC